MPVPVSVSVLVHMPRTAPGLAGLGSLAPAMQLSTSWDPGARLPPAYVSHVVSAFKAQMIHRQDQAPHKMW